MTSFRKLLRTYYKLTKPGIIRGNLMTAAAGYFLASKGHFSISLLLWMLIGISLIIACGCVFNNIIDRDVDKKMTRTANRALVTGVVSVRAAALYATVLGIVGFTVLTIYTNSLVVVIGIIGIFSYVVLYGYFKRHSIHGTLVGSISGSTSLVAGYCAVNGRFDLLAMLLFIIMSIWQMPHFYAIGIYKKKDYTKAGLPIWPVVRGIRSTKKWILGYIILYIFFILVLFAISYVGWTYLIVMLLISSWWLSYAIRGFQSKDDIKYGHQIFGFSLVTLVVFSLMISINCWLP